MRKQLLEGTTSSWSRFEGEIDCAASATIGYSAEDTGSPIENVFDGRNGPGGTRWISSRADTNESVVLTFDEPQTISRMIYEVEETECERTQEVRLEGSTDGGQSFRTLLVQEYTFSPSGATYQKEDLRLTLVNATHLRLNIVPNKGGSGRATLTSLRLFT